MNAILVFVYVLLLLLLLLFIYISSRFAVRAKSTNTDTWEASVYQLLQLVAYRAQDRGIAALAQADLNRWQLDMELWSEICGEAGESTKKSDNLTFSAIKTISQKEEYRFAHLSLQEFLYLDYRRTCQQAPPELATLFRDPKFDNVLRIAFSSPEVTTWLLSETSSLRLEEPDARQLSLLLELLKQPEGLRSVMLKLSPEQRDGVFVQRVRACSVWKLSLNRDYICFFIQDPLMLDLSNLDLTDAGALDLLTDESRSTKNPTLII